MFQKGLCISQPPTRCLAPGPGPQLIFSGLGPKFVFTGLGPHLYLPVLASNLYLPPQTPICIYRTWPQINIYQPWPLICVYQPWPTIFIISADLGFTYTDSVRYRLCPPNLYLLALDDDLYYWSREWICIYLIIGSSSSGSRVIRCQMTRWFHGWHRRFYWNLNCRMPSWTKYYPENFSFNLHMIQKLLLFEFCQKSAKIAYCQVQASRLHLEGYFWKFKKFPVNWISQNTAKGVETEPQILHTGRFKYHFWF